MFCCSQPGRRLPPQGSISADQITPYLFIGNYASAATKEFLTANRIGFVLNMTPFCHERLPDIIYLQLEAGDEEDFDLSQHFENGHSFIERARQSSSRVLVHCEMGISRSATIAMAHFIMQDLSEVAPVTEENCGEHRTLRHAWELVRSHRSCCCPNEGFFEQLLQLEKKLHGGKTSMTLVDYERVAHTARARMQMMLFDSLNDSFK